MSFYYNNLWKKLIDKNMSKVELKNAIKIAPATLAKLGKNKPVSMLIISKICDELECNIEDIVEYRSENNK